MVASTGLIYCIPETAQTILRQSGGGGMSRRTAVGIRNHLQDRPSERYDAAVAAGLSTALDAVPWALPSCCRSEERDDVGHVDHHGAGHVPRLQVPQ